MRYRVLVAFTYLSAAVLSAAQDYQLGLPAADEIFTGFLEARIVVRVNGSPVTTGTIVRRRYRQLFHMGLLREEARRAGRWSEEQEVQFQDAWSREMAQGVKEVVQEELLFQRAKALGLDAFPSLLERTYGALLAEYGGKERLRYIGLTENDVKEQAQRKLLVEYIVFSERPRGAPPGPMEVRTFYEKHMEDFRLEEEGVRLRLMVLMAIMRDPEKRTIVEDPEAEKRAEEIVQRLKKGEDFAVLARRHSADRLTARTGGLLVRRLPCGMLLDIVPPSTLRDNVQSALPTLKPGEPAGPLKDERVFLVLMLEKRFAAGLLPFDELREPIERHLAAENDLEVGRAWLRRILDNAVIADRGGRSIPVEFFLSDEWQSGEAKEEEEDDAFP